MTSMLDVHWDSSSGLVQQSKRSHKVAHIASYALQVCQGSFGAKWIISEAKITCRLFSFKLAVVINHVDCINCDWFIASNSLGTRNFLSHLICLIKLSIFFSHSASPEHYRCNLQWTDDKTLLIGWVDVVRVCQIRKRTMQEMVNRDLPEFVVDPGNQRKIHSFKISWIC